MIHYTLTTKNISKTIIFLSLCHYLESTKDELALLQVQGWRVMKLSYSHNPSFTLSVQKSSQLRANQVCGQDKILRLTYHYVASSSWPKEYTQKVCTHLNPVAERALTRHCKLSVAEMSNCLEQGPMTWTIE